MSKRDAKRNNVLAGFFLVASMVLAVVLAFWIEDGIQKLPFVNPKRSYTARFDIGEGVAGLKPGSPVTLGGKGIGSVDSIEYVYEERGAERVPSAIDVALEISSGIVVYPDATVTIVSPLLGTMSSLNISDIGGADGVSERLAEGGILDGRTPIGLADAAGVGGLTRTAESALEKIDRILTEIEPAVGPTIDDIDETLTGARSFAGMLVENQDIWAEKAGSILDHADGLFEGVIPELSGEINEGIGDTRRLIASAQAVVDENRSDIRSMVSNLEGTSARVQNDILARAERMLDEGVIAAANFSDVGSRTLGVIDRIEPALVRTATNAQLASAQGTVLLEEVRAAPWRLLERPDEKETREAVLLSAVRRYAGAVEKLRNASEALDSVLRGANAGSRELLPDQVVRMNAEIKASFEDMQDAERSLLDLLARQTTE